MSCEPRLNAAIKHSLVDMPVEVLHSRNLIDMNSSRLIQCLQTKGIVDIELHRSIVGTSVTSCLNTQTYNTHTVVAHPLHVAFGILVHQDSHHRMQNDW